MLREVIWLFDSPYLVRRNLALQKEGKAGALYLKVMSFMNHAESNCLVFSSISLPFHFLHSL